MCFVAVTALAYLDTDAWTGGFLGASIALTCAINVCRAWFRAANSANLGKFPAAYTASLCNGITMGGLIPVLVNLLLLSLNADFRVLN